MTNIFSYPLAETESLVFRTELTHFDVFSKHESTQERHIGTFKDGKWVFENLQQRQFFFLLFDQHRLNFGKAIKAYNRSLKEKPHLYEFRCIRKKFTLKISRIKRNVWQSVYNTFYGR